MPEKYVNIVNAGGVTKLDLSADTVTPETLGYGATAHNSAGAPIVGTAGFITVDDELSLTSENPAQNKVITAAIQNALDENETAAKLIDRIYQGVDLTVKFAAEIANYSDEWAWIKARITAGNFTGIHIGDIIPVTMTNGFTFNAQVAGINTYKSYGDTAVGDHIDFISKEIYSSLHPINKTDYNNGTAAQQFPWLASDMYHWLNSLSGDVPNGSGADPATVTVDYTSDGVYNYLPAALKAAIIEKRIMSPVRYSANTLLNDDNSWGWINIGKLWLPDEIEVCGRPMWGGKSGYSIGSGVQYPIFANNMNRIKLNGGGRGNWWLLMPSSGNSSLWCHVHSNGQCDNYFTSALWIGVPICFRVGAAS